MKGHNGWDLRTKFPDTPEGRRSILASYLMEFYRRGSDPPGYGIFFETICRLKRIWKLTFAHCHSIEAFTTKNAGESMAISDNTGNSTGSHLHLTTKPIAIIGGKHINLKQDNGYFGAVNPQEFFDELRQVIKEGGGMPAEMMQVSKADFQRLFTGSGNYDKTVGYLEIPTEDPTLTPFEKIQSVIAGYKSRGTDQENRAIKAEAERDNRIEEVHRLQGQLLDEGKLRKDLNDKLKEALKGYGGVSGVYEGRILDLQGQVDALAAAKGACLARVAELEAGEKSRFLADLFTKAIEIIKKLKRG